MKHIVAGIDIGGTNTVFGLTDRDGSIHATGSLKTSEYSDGEIFIQDLSIAISKALANDFKLIGIGIGCPNGNHYKGTMENAPNLNMKGVVPFVKRFEDIFSVPTVLTNDANAAAIGEMVFGGAKGSKDFIMVTLGTGVGSGFVANGQLIYGHDSFAGEIGHTIIFPDGRPCGCGRKGCLETYTSASGIAKTFIELTEKHNGKTLENITSYDVLLEAENENPIAIETFDYTAKILGLALSNAVCITSPSHIFLFGGPVKAGRFLLDPLQKYMEEYMLFVFKNKVKLQISELMDKNAAILGSAALVWDYLDRNKGQNNL
ncbi:MAG: ROK family protein [Bacteroidales bacterium]|jgi:glucokinase|nr:ROK family protein [Bacteroidales bacterium]